MRLLEVKLEKALKIIEKLRQDKKNRNILASLNINKRKKEKVQDTIIKQLRIGFLRGYDVTTVIAISYNVIESKLLRNNPNNRELIKDWSLLTVPHRSLSADQQNFFRDP